MSKDKEHLLRLETFFKVSQEWQDLKGEIQQMYRNADTCVHGYSDTQREIHVGKCLGIQEVLDLEKQFKK